MAIKWFTDYPEEKAYPSNPFITVIKRTGIIRLSRDASDFFYAKKATHVRLGWDAVHSKVAIAIAEPSNPGALGLSGGAKPGIKGPRTFQIGGAGPFFRKGLRLSLDETLQYEVAINAREQLIEFDPTKPWNTASRKKVHRMDKEARRRVS